jgi:hypothetical protein
MLEALIVMWMFLSVPMSMAHAFAGSLRVRLPRLESSDPRQKDQDKDAAAKRARELSDEAAALLREGSGESMRASVKKFEEAARLFAAAGDRHNEARTLNNIGGVYDDPGEKQKAPVGTQWLSARVLCAERGPVIMHSVSERTSC